MKKVTHKLPKGYLLKVEKDVGGYLITLEAPFNFATGERLGTLDLPLGEWEPEDTQAMNRLKLWIHEESLEALGDWLEECNGYEGPREVGGCKC